MNKKLFMIIIVLAVLASVAAPAAAVLPTKSPLPSGSPFNKIWDLLVDLQNQITSLKNQITNQDNTIFTDNCDSSTGHNWTCDQALCSCSAQCPAGTRIILLCQDPNGECFTFSPTSSVQTSIRSFPSTDTIPHWTQYRCEKIPA